MFTLIVVGKTKEPYYQAAEAEYIKRLKVFAKINILTTSAYSGEKNQSTERIKEKEGKRVLAKIKKDSYVVALDEKGTQISSRQVSEKLSTWQQRSQKIVFIIGGTYGLSEEVKNIAHEVWSLSKLTFTHEMVRTILLEQLYRGYTIIANKPYHY